MKKLFLGIGILVFCIGGALFVDYYFGMARTNDGKISVVTTFYPLATFAQNIGGDHVKVSTLVLPGSEPHDFEPTSRQIAELSRAKIFIYNGAGFEKWVDKLLPELQKNNVVIIDASRGIDLIQLANGQIDPHFWLDPVLASQEVSSIGFTLSDVDPMNKDYYSRNTEDYKKRLLELDGQIRNGLKMCTRSDVIASHDAFNYFARQYNFRVTSIAGLSPEEEPSPARMAEITKIARARDIRYIFFESLVSPQLSDTIAKEVGAQTLVFNPLEGISAKEQAEGKDYFSVQHDNLSNLQIALGCSQ